MPITARELYDALGSFLSIDPKRNDAEIWVNESTHRWMMPVRLSAGFEEDLNRITLCAYEIPAKGAESSRK